MIVMMMMMMIMMMAMDGRVISSQPWVGDELPNSIIENSFFGCYDRVLVVGIIPKINRRRPPRLGWHIIVGNMSSHH